MRKRSFMNDGTLNAGAAGFSAALAIALAFDEQCIAAAINLAVMVFNLFLVRSCRRLGSAGR